jgi:hypothetical protein
MSTQSADALLSAALSNVDKIFRPKIVQHYISTKTALVESRFEGVGLAAGKFCEATLRLLQQEVHGTHTAFGKSIPNFADECRKLVVSTSGATPEALRVVMPRALVFVYTVRNKRGIGHIGGDVDANQIDAVTISRTCDWIMCELVRVYHGLSLEEAQDIVDGLALRNIPQVWYVQGKRRVLRTDLSMKQKVLLICHQEGSGSVLTEDLFDWLEYSNLAVFRSKVLTPLHKDRLIEYDKAAQTVVISPLGIKLVEDTILKPQAIATEQ